VLKLVAFLKVETLIQGGISHFRENWAQCYYFKTHFDIQGITFSTLLRESGKCKLDFMFMGPCILVNTYHINANEMQTFYVLYLVLKALPVSDALGVHHQEHYKLQ
jgi:hypothetical protein